MDHSQAMQLLHEIELRLAFLGVDPDELAPGAQGEALRAPRTAVRAGEATDGGRARPARARRRA
jgi:hypothetical protein